jgi:glycosyltransferase involved in cell wall biosynthesis
MKILWLTWKDYTHPQAGGAELVLRELSRRLVTEGHAVTFLTIQHPGSTARELLDGIEIIRVGTSRYIHPLQAFAHYIRHMRNRYDIVIEVVNTAPYMAALFKGKSRAYVFYHQLAREIWFHELKKPFSSFGYYVMEPLATWLLSKAKAGLITISDSTLHDLQRFGFKKDQAHIISEGIEIKPVNDPKHITKFPEPTILSLGAMRAMKRTLDQVQAFELAKKSLPQLRLIIAGDTGGAYGKKVLEYIERSPYRKDITIEGRVSTERKVELMQKCHVFTATSVKEGWGLVVTEAASQGTPAVVYDVDGLRDSVRNHQTGIICDPNPEALATGIVHLLKDNRRYTKMRNAGWRWSKQITFDKSYADFKTALETA